MRCQICNRNLNNYESTVKYKESGNFADMCTRHLKELREDGVAFVGRTDLEPHELVDGEGANDAEDR